MELEFWICEVICRRGPGQHWLDARTGLPVRLDEARGYIAHLKKGHWIYLDGRVMNPVSCERTYADSEDRARAMGVSTGREHRVIMNTDISAAAIGVSPVRART